MCDGLRACSVQYVVDVDDLIGPIDGIEDAPVSYGIFAQLGKVRGSRLVAEIVDVRGDPFRLVEQPLGHRLTGLSKILHDRWAKGKPIPGHCSSPSKSELSRDLFSGDALGAGEGLPQSLLQRLAQLEPKIGVS